MHNAFRSSEFRNHTSPADGFGNSYDICFIQNFFFKDAKFNFSQPFYLLIFLQENMAKFWACTMNAFHWVFMKIAMRSGFSENAYNKPLGQC